MFNASSVNGVSRTYAYDHRGQMIIAKMPRCRWRITF